MFGQARALAAFSVAAIAACAARPLPVTPPVSSGPLVAATSSPPPSAATASAGDSVSTHERTLGSVAEGVYVIRHEDAPDTFPQGNTTVIVGERETLVVDSCYLPSSAQKDIKQIRQWTNKPVRYLLNTHWHYDHTMGNGAYRDAFPSIIIVAHDETRKQIAGYNPQWFAKFPQRADPFRQQITSGKDPDGKALTEGEIAELKTGLLGIDPVWTEFRPLAARKDLAPNMSFEREIDMISEAARCACCT